VYRRRVSAKIWQNKLYEKDDTLEESDDEKQAGADDMSLESDAE
jgi:hypothetical protein